MQKNIITIILTLCLLFLSSSLCAENEDTVTKCAKCGMVIDQEAKKFSVMQTEVSKPIRFDDIHCALLWRDNQCISIQMSFDVTARVFDFYTEESIYMKDAVYVNGAGTNTPMMSGIVAFKDSTSAKRFVAEHGGGKVLSYDELLLQVSH